MKYEHQNNWANSCYTNLDISISRSVRNARIVLLSTLTLHPPECMANSEVCTLCDRKNLTNSYDFIQITQVYALSLSIFFKPIFVDVAIVIDMLSLSAIHHRRVCIIALFIYVNIFVFDKKSLRETFTVVFLFSTFFHKILHISTFFHKILPISTWKNEKIVEIGKILWKNVENKKTTVKVSRNFFRLIFFQENTGIHVCSRIFRNLLDLFYRAECS